MSSPSPAGAFVRVLFPALLLIGLVYAFGLGHSGLLGPDEPRYASIGRAMAQSGDWVTPRLMGKPWFEKPALLYWLVGLGHRLGLHSEWAARVPVALLSVAFLGFFAFALRRLAGASASLFGTMMLASMAGWIAFSQVAATDLPLS